MNNKGSRAASAVLVAVIQILCGLLVAVVFLATSALRAVFSLIPLGGSYSVAPYVAVGLCLAALLFFLGIRTFGLVSRYQKVRKALDKKAMDKDGRRISLEELSKLTYRQGERLVDDLMAMIDRGLFPWPVQLDLYRDVLIAGVDGPVAEPEPDPAAEFVYKQVVRKPVLPVYAIGICWLVYALVLPLYKWSHYVIAAVLSLGVYLLAKKMMRPRHRLVKTKRPQAKREPVRTGDKEADQALRAAMEQLEEMRKLDRSIGRPEMGETVRQLLAVAGDILDHVAQNTAKIRQIKQFLNYYLPTTVKLLRTYEEFERQPEKGENIRRSMKKIEGMMQDVLAAFSRELDNLYLDRAIDVSADIDVMQSMLQREGIGALQTDDKVIE